MIEAVNVNKKFGNPEVHVLHDINLKLPDEKFISINGRSGSGKSTLLYVLSSLDTTTSGNIFIDGKNIQDFNSHDLHVFRNEHMGFIFQFHYLLPELTALENVLMPARKTNRNDELEDKAIQLLESFQLQGKFDRLPKQLSGGERQRVAIARALIMSPKYIFADEPTGNLDSNNGEIVMNILKDITRKSKVTVIYVTHDPDYAELADIKVSLVDGRVVE